MTTTITTLAEFLLARIDEEAEVASMTHFDAYAHSVEDSQFIHRWNPERVLVECAAKRRIVEVHADQETDFDGPGCVTCNDTNHYDGSRYVPDGYPCPTLRALAAVYTNHPDFDESWSL